MSCSPVVIKCWHEMRITLFLSFKRCRGYRFDAMTARDDVILIFGLLQQWDRWLWCQRIDSHGMVMDPMGRSPLIASEYALHWHRLILYRVLHNHRDLITLSRGHSRTHSLKVGVTPVYPSPVSSRQRCMNVSRYTCVIYIYIYICI